MGRRAAIVALLVAATLAGIWMIFARAPGLYNTAAPAAAPADTPAPAAERKIKATLYYISEDGLSLVGVEREVAFGDSIVEQGRRILEAQLREAPAPFASAIPAGTALRGLFIGERGE